MLKNSMLSVSAPTGISVWKIVFDEIDRGYSWISLLSAEEQKRRDSYHFRIDQLRFSASRAALRILLAERLNITPDAVVFTENNYGKPLIEGSSFAFNVSHSGNFGLIAIAERGFVGVDIEKHQPLDYRTMAQQFFSPTEAQLLLQCQTNSVCDTFFRIWTGKEAVLKAAGIGITEHLTSFSLLPTDGSFLLRPELPAMASLFSSVSLRPLPVPAGYSAALASLAIENLSTERSSL